MIFALICSPALLLPGVAHAPARAGALRMSALKISGNNVDVTDSMRDYAIGKLGKPLERFSELLNDATDTELHLKIEKRGVHDEAHRGAEIQIAEVTAYCKGKHVIRATSEGDDMYASLDELGDTLTRKLRKYKERKRDVKQDARRGDKAANAEAMLEDEDVMGEIEAPRTAAAAPAPFSAEVVRSKTFPMPPISVDDAILCLEYIDHDFYVFRNSATDEVNVVYRRNSGGVGHIEPEKA